MQETNPFVSGPRPLLLGLAVALCGLLACSGGEDDPAPASGGNGSGASPATGGASPAGGAGPGSGGSPGSGGALAGGGDVGSGGSPLGGTSADTGGASGSGGGGPVGVPCGEGWAGVVPGNVDLGLASNPETPGISGGAPDERAIFDQINAERVAAGLAPLGWSDQVANVARSHAADMNQLDYFDHGSSTRPYRDENDVAIRDNWLPFPRLDFVYPGDFQRAGENIAMTPNPVENATEMWMNSEGHRDAILDNYGWTADVGAIGIDGNMVVFNPAQCAR